MPGGPPYDLSEIAQWLVVDTNRRAKKAAARSESGDPDPDDPDNASAGRLRDIRIALAEHELAEKQKNAIDRSLARETLSRMARVLRQAGERIQRQVGPVAFAIWEEAVESMAAETETGFGKPSDDGDDNETVDD